MKKFIYSALFLLMSTVAFSSCEEDYINPLSDEPVTHDVLPEVFSAGTYEGTFEITQESDNSFVGSYVGQIVVEGQSNAYTARVTVSSSENTAIDASDIVNCFWSDETVYLYNNAASNFGAAGIVLGNFDGKTLQLHYYNTIRVGRVTKATKIAFTGSKK